VDGDTRSGRQARHLLDGIPGPILADQPVRVDQAAFPALRAKMRDLGGHTV
jgi:hypothetical protein